MLNRLLLLLLGISLVLNVILGSSYQAISRQQDNKDKEISRLAENQKKKEDSRRDFNVVPYTSPSTLPVTSEFSDTYLGVVFQYPSIYKIYSLNAVEEDAVARVYFLKYADIVSEKSIQDDIDCWKEMRIYVDDVFERGGNPTRVYVCNGGGGSIVRVYIKKIVDSNNEFAEIKDKYCDKTIEDNKTIFSCLSNNLDETVLYRYVAYILLSSDMFKLSIQTTNATQDSELIGVVISTFRSIN